MRPSALRQICQQVTPAVSNHLGASSRSTLLKGAAAMDVTVRREGALLGTFESIEQYDTFLAARVDNTSDDGFKREETGGKDEEFCGEPNCEDQCQVLRIKDSGMGSLLCVPTMISTPWSRASVLTLAMVVHLGDPR